jgi:FkbM family methyltransferase
LAGKPPGAKRRTATVTVLRGWVGRSLRWGVERATGWKVLTKVPRGVNLAYDLRRSLPWLGIRIVLDVGANLGQSTDKYLRAFPAAKIYSFEPVIATFNQLKERFADESRVECLAVALGSNRGQGEMVLAGSSERFMLLEHYNRNALDPQEGVQAVPIETIDDFCSANCLQRVDFLKVDTEGHDLDVLRGAESMLSEQRIAVVQTEVGMSPLNTLHAAFEVTKAHLEKRGYYLFGIYAQAAERRLNSPVLRRTDAVFVSKRVADGKTY